MVEDWPLATMDYQTMKPSEVHPTDIFRERHDFMGQTVSINYSPEQKWYYLDKQTPEEVTLIKIWDNKEDVARPIPLISYAIAPKNDLFQFSLKSTPNVAIKAPSTAVDVLIIGGGPAGLSAATTLYRHQHDIRIFDDGKPRNVWETAIHATPTWEGQNPNEFRRKSRKELAKTGLVDFISSTVESIQKKDDGLFYVRTSDGVEWTGRKVLLSTGVRFAFLDIPGYEENFPERIFHCLFTFGYDHRGSSSAGILAVGYAGSPFHANILVDDARKFTDKVTIYTNGNEALAGEIQKVSNYNDTAYDHRKITRFTKLPKSIQLHFDDGKIKEEAFIVHQPGTKVNPSFVEQLGLELSERGDIVTKMPFYQTNVAGVYAAGDAANPFKIISSAMLQGANAGAGIARELPIRVTGNAIDRLS
ncbi:hypothetical protein SLS60_004320 [Paraconiothyrium brasiliense]|uniref:FAD/NAD(P)-binding domain-containing protein n=1 Tax=Paraconiothyrium brasiliense TaxID=300254 RepID=A0ABR3RK10_9PLEO